MSTDMSGTSHRKIVLYIATSLDGYIARDNGDIDWLSMVKSQNEDYGYKDFLKSVDTVVMGHRTYDQVPRS
jgi:dihydrofolate reductase